MRARRQAAIVRSFDFVPLILSVLLPVGASAQTGNRAATDLDHTEIQAYLTRAVQEGLSDRILALVDVGPYNVGAAVVIRRVPGNPGKGIGNIGGFLQHDTITEVYYVIRGSGVQVTGGRMIGGAPNSGTPSTGPGVGGGTRIEGGVTSTLEVGDLTIIPPGVPHGWQSVSPDGIDYIVIRVDPDHVLAKEPSRR